MRGRTLNDAFIILDEAQNTSPEQMKMFLTRLGFGSTMVVTGDIDPGRPARRHGERPAGGPGNPGRLDDIAFCRLTSKDVVRHRLVSEIVDAYARHDAGRLRRRPAAAPRDASVSIEIANETGVEVDADRLAALARFLLDRLRIHPLAELSVRSSTCRA